MKIASKCYCCRYNNITNEKCFGLKTYDGIEYKDLCDECISMYRDFITTGSNKRNLFQYLFGFNF